MDAPSWHILEENVVTQLQGLGGSIHPSRRFRHCGRVVVRGATGWIWRGAGNHLIGGLERLGILRGRYRLCATQVGEVRVGLVPAAELALGLADASIALAPP